MKLTLYFLTCFVLVPLVRLEAQARPADVESAAIQRDHDLHLRALGIVQAEKARAKQTPCSGANSTLDITSCQSKDLGVTNANYVKLVRSLGTLLRSGSADKPLTSPIRIPFDDAETAWLHYRDLACSAAGEQYAGGSVRSIIEISCRQTVTRHHMDELWAIYADLGTH